MSRSRAVKERKWADRALKQLRKVEASLRPKAERIVTTDKQGMPVIEYRYSGLAAAFDKNETRPAEEPLEVEQQAEARPLVAAMTEEAEKAWFPETPVLPQNGNQVREAPMIASGGNESAESIQAHVAPGVVAGAEAPSRIADRVVSLAGGFQQAEWAGNQEELSPERSVKLPSRAAGRNEHLPENGLIPGDSKADDNPLTDLIERACAQQRGLPQPGRKNVLDAEARGKLIALLVVGFSLRQAAGVIGVSHTALRKLLARDPELMTEVNVSRSRAAMEPLAVVIRESKRSWRAATWLLKYLDSKLYSREETLDEWEQRMEDERAEFKKRNRSR